MGKTTSFPASIAGQLIADGTIERRGSLFPEEVFRDELFDTLLSALRRRGVAVTQTTR
jgi:saccharopine dehydrogenase-like NADP-dependent oxidoreductase